MKARMKALQMMMKEKPAGMEEIMSMKKKKGLEEMFSGMEDESEGEMEGEEQMEDGKIAMVVSPKEKKLIMMFRAKTKGMEMEDSDDESYEGESY